MTISVITPLALLWMLMGVKTWAFSISDLSDHNPDRLTVISSLFVGALWPLTYVVLSLILMFGVNSQSLKQSIYVIRKAWSRKR